MHCKRRTLPRHILQYSYPIVLYHAIFTITPTLSFYHILPRADIVAYSFSSSFSQLSILIFSFYFRAIIAFCSCLIAFI